MGRSKVNLDQIAWSEISSGSLGGPASFIGLNTDNAPVLVAASDYTTAGGGSGISHDGSTADGVLTYKDSDEATVESGLTFNGTTLLASADDVRIRLNGDTNSHPGLELAEDGTRKWIVYNNYTNDDLTFKTDTTIRMVIEQDGDVKIGSGDLYVDKIRRASDSDTTTKILLNDEAIKLYAGHSTDNICTIDSTGLKIDNGSLETATIDYTDGDLSMTIADGGKVTFASGFAVGSDAAGDILYHNGTSYIRLAKGSADQVLTMNDAATAPNWEDASGGSDTDTFVTDNFGFFKFTNDNLHGHPTYVNKSRYDQINMNLSGKVTYGTDVDGDTFTATIVNSILYVKNGIVPVACTLDSFTVQGYLVEAMSNGNAQFSIWKGAVPSDATAYSTDVTWTRIGTVTWAGTGADDTWYKGTDTLSASNSFAAGDWWAITVQPGGTDTALSSGNSAYFASMVWSPT